MLMMTSRSGGAYRDVKTEKENSWKEFPWIHLTEQGENHGMQEVDYTLSTSLRYIRAYVCVEEDDLS